MVKLLCHPLRNASIPQGEMLKMREPLISIFETVAFFPFQKNALERRYVVLFLLDISVGDGARGHLELHTSQAGWNFVTG